MASDLRTELHHAEARLLNELRALRKGVRSVKPRDPSQLTMGQKIADTVASTMGSWRFIIIQSVILLVWIILNVTAVIEHWDPYPFILLNLALSFQAAYAAPFIMMAQNRQQDIDRKEAETDHQVNIKAELEIELLHQKIDELREREVLFLTEAVRDLSQLLQDEKDGVIARRKAGASAADIATKTAVADAPPPKPASARKPAAKPKKT
ncbi:MAG TPA: DUF1003 domain-containing protein [Caulobacteraceae bacterium]|jgi:uncharacterized membrane protein